jgi:hypothetical protein
MPDRLTIGLIIRCIGVAVLLATTTYCTLENRRWKRELAVLHKLETREELLLADTNSSPKQIRINHVKQHAQWQRITGNESHMPCSRPWCPFKLP